MISPEVQRTLVKSPPELWAELSDPVALARHLGELGEIRITRLEPEKLVEWEATDTSGKVLLKPSGWGTKVTLTVTREVAAPAPQVEAEPEPAVEVESEIEAHPVIEADPELVGAVEEPAVEKPAAEEPVPAMDESEHAIEKPEPEATLEESKPRAGFFARLFRRRPQDRATPELPEPLAGPEPAIKPGLASEPEPVPVSEDAIPPPAEPAEDVPDIAAELKAAEEAAADEVTAVLTAVLDRLGAAHHRPFSRA
jgi:hypothetical protein